MKVSSAAGGALCPLLCRHFSQISGHAEGLLQRVGFHHCNGYKKKSSCRLWAGLGLKKYFVWHKGAPVPAAARGPQQPCHWHYLLKSPWLGARAPTLHKSEAEGSLMYHCNNNYLLLLNLEGRGVLKSHPATSVPHPCAWYQRPALCTALQLCSAFCQPPFLCQSDGFCQVPDMLCPHAHKYPRAERGEHGAHSDHALHPPVHEHTHTRAHTHAKEPPPSLPPCSWGDLGFGDNGKQ